MKLPAKHQNASPTILEQKKGILTMNDIPIRCRHDRLVNPNELKPNPRNPREHPQEQIETLARIISETGWRRPVTVSNRTGLVVCGHGAILAAKVLGCKVPVEDQEFESEEQEYAHLLADNRLTEVSTWNDEELAAILKDLDAKDKLLLSGFTELDPSILNPVKVKSMDLAKNPPKLAWVLVSIPLVRFVEIQSLVEAIAATGASVQTTYNDGEN